MSTNTPVVHKWSKPYPFILIFLVIALILSYALIAPIPTISRSNVAVTANSSNVQRGWEAYAARYQAMAQAYAAKEASTSISVQRNRAAEIVRLNGIAAAYAAMETARIQHSWDAYAARYAAMGKQYASGQNIQRGWNAYAARYQAMADQYTARETANIQRGWDAYAARYAVMAEREVKKLETSTTP